MRIARIRHYPDGMRTVEMNLEHRILQWAERRGVVASCVREDDDIVVTFDRPEYETLFALEFPGAD